MAQWVMNLTNTHKDSDLIPGLAPWLSVAMNCGVGCRGGSDPELLWLWCRLAAVALIWPLAWELPYATQAPPPPKKEKGQNSYKCIKTNSKIFKNLGHLAYWLTGRWPGEGDSAGVALEWPVGGFQVPPALRGLPVRWVPPRGQSVLWLRAGSWSNSLQSLGWRPTVEGLGVRFTQVQR